MTITPPIHLHQTPPPPTPIYRYVAANQDHQEKAYLAASSPGSGECEGEHWIDNAETRNGHENEWKIVFVECEELEDETGVEGSVGEVVGVMRDIRYCE
jgi:hypothetical protein